MPTDKGISQQVKTAAFTISCCPTCGSSDLRKTRRNWTGEARGKSYMVPQLDFYECPACGERIYDRESMRLLQSFSPAFTAHQRRSA